MKSFYLFIFYLYLDKGKEIYRTRDERPIPFPFSPQANTPLVFSESERGRVTAFDRTVSSIGLIQYLKNQIKIISSYYIYFSIKKGVHKLINQRALIFATCKSILLLYN